MLNELITWVLNTYLGKYLEDFNPAQLSVALLSGEVELENVPIRKDALCALGIPIQAFSGNIGKIKLQVPVRKFRTAPWCITIEHVYAVFGPKDLNDWDDEKERKTEFEYKLAELDAYEAQWRSNKGMPADNYYSTSYTNWLNCGTSLATNILENLELKIHDVHLRYEDTINVAGSSIAAGIKIAALTMQTCDENWLPSAQWSNSDEGISYKLIELRDFSVYWDHMTPEQACATLKHSELLQNLNIRCSSQDHRYLISPITARAHCKRERCKQAIRSKNRPRLSCEILIPVVQLTLSNRQYEQIIECTAGLRYISTIRSYRVRRPKQSISENGSAANWWRYAAHCHGYIFRTSAEQANIPFENIRYMRIYRRLLVNPNENLSKADKDFKRDIEQLREVNELQLLRQICCEYVFVTNQAKARQNPNERGGRSMLFHWFPNWLGWYGNSNGESPSAETADSADTSKNDDANTVVAVVNTTNTTPTTTVSTISQVLTNTSSNSSLVTATNSDYGTLQSLDVDYQKIENELLNALETSFENESFSKRDAVFGYLTFILIDGQFVINMETATGSTTTKLEMDFKQLTSVIEIKPRFSNYSIGISLGSVCLRDMLTNGTHFPYLIRPQAENGANTNSNTGSKYHFSNIKHLLQKSVVMNGKPKQDKLDVDHRESETSFGSTNSDNSCCSNAAEPWFQLQYEKSPLDIQCDVRLVVKSRSLDIVYNKEAFEWLAQFITRPIAQYEISSSIPNKQDETRENEQQPRGRLRFLQSWKQLLIGSKLQNRKTWSYEIDISAPQIIFVENFLEKQTTIVLMDFGRFQLMKNKTRRKDSVAASTTTTTTTTTQNVTATSPQPQQQQQEQSYDDDEDDQFMTPCSTPPGSEISKSESPTNNSLQAHVLNPEQLNDAESIQLENAFHNKLYDKYNINLTDMQILICRVSMREKAGFMQIRAHSTGSHHLLDRFNIALHVERRILYTTDPEYPSLTVHATLPKLVAHIDEQNINTFLKIVYPLLQTPQFFVAAEPKSSDEVDKTNIYNNNTHTATTALPTETDDDTTESDTEPSLRNTNLIVSRFQIGQLILEMKSSKKSIAEMQIHGINVGITRRMMDTHLNMSVHGLLLVDAIQSFGHDFELLVASHRHVGMDSISGSLRHSEPCSPIQPDSPDPLGNYRPLSPRLLNQAVNSLQVPEQDYDFNSVHTPALITVEINHMQDTVDEEPMTVAIINFFNLDVIANQETIVELLGFFNQIMCTIEYFRNQHQHQHQLASIAPQSSSSHHSMNAATSAPSLPQRIEISFEFHRLNVLVMRTVHNEQQSYVVGRKVGTLTMSEAKIDASLGDERDISISGSLGGIQIIDITPEGVNHQRIFSVGKDPLTAETDGLLSTLTHEIYGRRASDADMPENNALMFQVQRHDADNVVSLKIRMASVWYTHCPRFIQEISECISQFRHFLKEFVRSVRNKATNMAMEFVHASNEFAAKSVNSNSNSSKSRISLDIILNSPVIVLPRSSMSMKVFVANLGQISVYNTHEEQQQHEKQVERQTRQQYLIEVKNINLYSLNTANRKDIRVGTLPKAHEFYSCASDALEILHDTALFFSITKETTKLLELGKMRYESFFTVVGSVTEELKVSLTRAQFKQLNEAVRNATQFNEFVEQPAKEAKPVELVEQLGETNMSVLDGQTQQTKQRIHLGTSLRFTVPVLKLQLKNEACALMEISFCEFVVNYHHRDKEQDMEVLLRSIVVEDLQVSKYSKFRNVVDSDARRSARGAHARPARSEKAQNVAKSCANLLKIPVFMAQQQQQSIRNSISLPANLNNWDMLYEQHSIEVMPEQQQQQHPQQEDGRMSVESDKNLVIYKSNTQDGLTNSCIDFNCLNLTLSVERWFTVLDFFGIIESDAKQLPKTAKKAVATVHPKYSSKLKVTVRSLNLILVRNENELAKANISNAYLKICQRDFVETVEGRLGSISLYDLTRYGGLYREKFSTAGPEALNFHYKRLVFERTERSLDKDSLLTLQMSSVRYIHTKRFLFEIHMFVNDLLQLQTPVMKHMQSDTKGKPTSKVAGSNNNSNRALQIGLEIHAAAPIILLPMSYENSQLIVADLGKLTLRNNFLWACNEQEVISRRSTTEDTTSKPNDELDFVEILDVMHVDLVDINLYAGEWQEMDKPYAAGKKLKNNEICLRIGDYAVIKQGNSLFEDTCYFKLQIERNTDAQISHQCADLSVQGTLSKLDAVIQLQQYRLIRGFLMYNLGEDISDIYNNYTFDMNQSIERLINLQQQQQKDVAVEPQMSEQNVWKTMSISFLLQNVTLLIALEQPLTKATTVNNEFVLQPLACIKFIKSSLEIDSYSDGAQDIDLISSEILLLDSRTQEDANNVFKLVLQPLKGLPSDVPQENIVQAEIHSRRRANHSKYTILLNNMRIMAIFDYIERLKDFLQAEPHMPAKLSLLVSSNSSNNNNNNNYADIRQQFNRQKCQSNETDSVLEIILNITNSEIVFVEKLDQLDTNAIILKSTTVFTYKWQQQQQEEQQQQQQQQQLENIDTPVSVDINHLEVFSCILGEEEHSALSIIDPFSLHIELRGHCLHMLIPKQLYIRLSYNDVKLFHRMLQSVQQQQQQRLPHGLAAATAADNCNLTHNNLRIAPLLAMGFNATDSWAAMLHCNFDLNRAASWLLQQQRLKQAQYLQDSQNALSVQELQLSADRIYCCIIDDCMDADVPLLEFSLAQLKYTQQIQSKRLASDAPITAQLHSIFACDYYNRRLSGWEPIIEAWPCAIECRRTHNMSLHVQSKQLLRFNVTSTLIELCEMVRHNWTQDYDNNDVRQRRAPFVPFALSNQTGEVLQFKTISAQPGGITHNEIIQQDIMQNWLTVLPEGVQPFDFGTHNKLRHMDSHKMNVHQLLLQIEGWKMIEPVSIDKVGVYFRYSTHEKHFQQRTRIVVDISLVGSAQKLITVKSALNIVNKLDRGLWLKMEQRAGTERDEWLKSIEPDERVTVPLRYVDALLFIKPQNAGKAEQQNVKQETRIMESMSYCTRGIAWRECVSKEPLQELYTCYGLHKQLFHTLVEVRADKYPDTAKLPGHTISVLAPLKLRNLLCSELSYQLENQQHQGRVGAGNTAFLYDVNMQQSIILSLTLENYKVSGQLKIPLGHSGVVEPKLKLIDVHNRELLLRVSIQFLPGNGMEIFVSAPIWLINKTGLPLIFRQEGTGHLASGQFEEHETARVVTPLLFSFSDQEGSPALEMRLGQRYGGNNLWCKGFNIHKDIAFRELRAENSKGCFTVGINVRRGRGIYACTTFVTLSPRFQLYNRTQYRLELAQKCDIQLSEPTVAENLIEALPGCNFPFHWPNCEQEPLLCVRILNIPMCHWSHGMPINEAQSLYVTVRNDVGEMWFLRLEVISRQATLLLLFTDAQLLPPPIRIDNYAQVQINFHQAGCRPCWNTYVRPLSSLAYAWDDPLGLHALKIEAPGGNAVDYSLNRLEISKPLTYANFIYIAFKATFMGDDSPQLVLGVRDRRVVLMRKCTGNRQQLWLMNSNGQLEHEGSSPPAELGRMVLDLEKAPSPLESTRLVIRPPNKQRSTTQKWRFVNGRLMCHANMCVQPVNGIYGLRDGTEAVVRIETDAQTEGIPYEQAIEIQKLRPGSGHLEVSGKMDGPIRTIQIRDVMHTPAEFHKSDPPLIPDPQWKHASMQAHTGKPSERNSRQEQPVWFKECNLSVALETGIGVSVITRQPCEELAYISFEQITMHAFLTAHVKTFELNVKDVQIDNQLLETSCPVLLHTIKQSNTNETDEQEELQEALEAHMLEECNEMATLIRKKKQQKKRQHNMALYFGFKLLNSPNRNAVIFEYVHVELRPCAVYLEERLILKAAVFLGFGKMDNAHNLDTSAIVDPLPYDVNVDELTRNAVRYYFESLTLGRTQVRLSVLTAPKLNADLMEVKKALGLTLVKFEDTLIEFNPFSLKHQFETTDLYLKAIRIHYINQLKWHAAAILASVDFLGNPLGFANDLSEGVSGLLFEGSVKSLVKNVTHGISNSTAKLTETLSDSLGRVMLDEHDNETRQKILELPSNTSGGHLAAGLKGFGFGLLGGVTSIVRHTYVGALSDGFPGFLSGLGKGLVGTVTKPLIGVLDLASETANAVRETSKNSSRSLPGRKRLPRCVSGAPGGLLPTFSYRQAKGQQYLYVINRRNFTEKLMAYEPNLCNDQEAKLRLLVSTEYIRIFSRCDEDPTIMFECHLSEVISCHPLTTHTAALSKALEKKKFSNDMEKDRTNKNEPAQLVACHYIEISTSLPKITRPRVRCQNEQIAERAARCINYAKSIFDEREQSVTLD